MEKFCKHCGKVKGIDGKCPTCDASVSTPPKKRTKKPIDPRNVKFIPRKNGKMNKIVLWTLISLISITVILTTLCTLVYFDKLNIPFINDTYIYLNWKEEEVEEIPTEETEPEPTKPDKPLQEKPKVTNNNASTRVDADEYYNNNTNVVSEFSVDDSQDIHSESDAYDNFVNRGFDQNPITTTYSISGEYCDEKEISSYSSTMHPMYQTWYITPSGVLWQIVEINGTIMASGISEDMTNAIVVSETDTITSYDSKNNKFYVNTPNMSEMKITKVDIIDAATLDNISVN